jgi:hypothetical protein
VIRSLMELWKTPSAESLAQRELEEAQRDLLAAQSRQEYYLRMTQYNLDRIARLKARQTQRVMQ